MAFNILIVDDSETSRAVIIKTLQIAEVPLNDVFQASHGREGLAVLSDRWIDLVFADINMPVMNGIEMVDRMWEDGLLKTIPVVIVSTVGNKTLIDQFMAKGVKAYVRKPFTPEQIRSLMWQILGVADAS